MKNEKLRQSVRAKRLSLGLSLRKLSKEVDVSTSTLSRLEGHVGNPDEFTIARLGNWINGEEYRRKGNKKIRIGTTAAPYYRGQYQKYYVKDISLDKLVLVTPRLFFKGEDCTGPKCPLEHNSFVLTMDVYLKGENGKMEILQDVKTFEVLKNARGDRE